MELRVGTFPAAPAESAHKSTRDLGVVGCSRRSSGGRIRVEHLLSPTCHQPLSRSSSSPPPSPSPNPLASSPDVFAHHASQGTCSFKYNLEPQVAWSTIKTSSLSDPACCEPEIGSIQAAAPIRRWITAGPLISGGRILILIYAGAELTLSSRLFGSILSRT